MEPASRAAALRGPLGQRVSYATYTAVMSNRQIYGLWGSPFRVTFLGSGIWRNYMQGRVYSTWRDWGYSQLFSQVNQAKAQYTPITLTTGGSGAPADPRFLTADMIRRLRAERGTNLICHRTPDEDVGKCRADIIPAQGERSNPLANENYVWFFSGVIGLPYGQYHVLFDRSEIAVQEYGGGTRPGEYVAIGRVPAARALGWTTTEEAQRALSGAG